MQYKKVEIKLAPAKNKYHVFFSEVPGDRTDDPPLPHSGGWYYFPAYMDEEVAFNALKQCMVNRFETEIARLQQHLDNLKAVKMP